MPTPKNEDKDKDKKRLVVCPECDTEVDLEETDECPKCELNVAKVYEQRRYRKALRKLEEDDERESGAKKKKKDTDWNPF